MDPMGCEIFHSPGRAWFFLQRHPLIEKVHQEGIAFMDPRKHRGNQRQSLDVMIWVVTVVFFFRFSEPIFDQNQKKKLTSMDIPGSWRYVICLPFGGFVLGKKAHFFHTLGRSRYVFALLKRLNMKDFSCHVGEITRGYFDVFGWCVSTCQNAATQDCAECVTAASSVTRQERWKKQQIESPLWKGKAFATSIWVFPKMVGFPPKSSILIGFSYQLIYPDAQCMVYLPTFTPKTTQM